LIFTDTNAENPVAYGLEAPNRIGIMADSHGQAALIDAAAAYFQSRGCAVCVHLGDIIDTTRPETIQDCLNRLSRRQIYAIRGNNEHTLLLNQSTGIGDEVLETIRSMPLCRRIASALLAHSLPFEAALGPRCMLEDMDADHLRRFFQSYPEMQLFRGHSHQPEMVRLREASLYRENIRPGHPLPLKSRQPAVITCGALADRLCLVWDRRQETIELIALAAAGT
jgi:predicted phosphodiesterase